MANELAQLAQELMKAKTQRDIDRCKKAVELAILAVAGAGIFYVGQLFGQYSCKHLDQVSYGVTIDLPRDEELPKASEDQFAQDLSGDL